MNQMDEKGPPCYACFQGSYDRISLLGTLSIKLCRTCYQDLMDKGILDNIHEPDHKLRVKERAFGTPEEVIDSLGILDNIEFVDKSEDDR